MNVQEAEPMVKYVGQFQTYVRSFRAVRSDCFMSFIQSIHREVVCANALSNGKDSMYLGPVSEEPFCDGL